MEFRRPIIELVLNSPETAWTGKARNLSNEILRPNYLWMYDYNSESLLTPAQFGCLTGLLLILFSNYQIDKEKLLSRLWFLLSSSSLREFLFVTVSFLVLMLFMPLHLLALGGFWLFKRFDEKKLRNNQKSGFKKFLNGEDVMWACESEKTKSVINVLAYVRAPNEIESHIPENLLQSIRNRISTKLMVENPYPKMFYRRRKSDSGYYYWTDENNLKVEDYVRYTEDSKFDDDIQCEDELRTKVGAIANNPLPANNTALWECLVCPKAVRVKDLLRYPIIFRVHHSVGDGIALLRLVLETLADQISSPSPIDLENLSEYKESFSEKIARLAINLITFIKMPSVLFTMLLKKIDKNQIHPEVLTGRKKINWLYESDPTDNCTTLLTLVKLLKRQFVGARFSNILLAALSKSLRDFFEKRNYDIPKDVTVVIPARLNNGRESRELKLENKFSVAMQTLPIDVLQMNDRISRVKKYSDIANSSPEFLINYWMMSFVSMILPDWILKAIMYSKHSTLAISNLPGPNFAIKINGYELENVGFFLPNIDQTACGVTILSYNNKLHFGILADEASIKTNEDLGEIVQGMAKEIQEMAEKYLKN